MTWTLCTSGSAVLKAGLYANSTITASGSALAGWCDEAESLACVLIRSNGVSNFTSLTANGKQILADFVSSYIAQKIVAYDMSGYTSRGEAVQTLNVLENNIRRIQDLFKEDKYKTYLAIT